MQAIAWQRYSIFKFPANLNWLKQKEGNFKNMNISLKKKLIEIKNIFHNFFKVLLLVKYKEIVDTSFKPAQTIIKLNAFLAAININDSSKVIYSAFCYSAFIF